MHTTALLASLLLLVTVSAAATLPVTHSVAQRVTWSTDIEPIVSRSCAPCHQPNGPGPFPLQTYADARSHAHQIAQVTSSRFMPPWLPDPNGIPLAHERRLTDSQIALLQRWDTQDAPAGDSHISVTPQRSVPAGGLGDPDQIVRMSVPYTLPGETTSPFRCFVLPLAPPADRWLRAIKFLPGNSAVVRHIVLYADSTGTAHRLEATSGAVGYVAPDAGLGPDAQRLAEWAVGSDAWGMPAGSAEKLVAGSDLVLLVRFETDGRPEPVQIQVELYYGPTPTSVPVSIKLGSPDVILQPPQKASVADGVTLPVPVQVVRITPHGHPICRHTARPGFACGELGGDAAANQRLERGLAGHVSASAPTRSACRGHAWRSAGR